MAEIVRRGVESLLEVETPNREDLWANASTLVGAFQDAGDASDVSARHDAFLDEAFG